MSKVEKRNFGLKMQFACGNDDLRPVMQHVYFDNGFMVATDAHVLVKAAAQHFSDFDKSEVEILNGKFIHKNTFKKILSCDQVIVTEEGVQDLATKDIYKFATVDIKYPNYNAVIPKETSPIDYIGISTNIVTRLFKVMQNIDGVKLLFSGSNRAIKIEGLGEHEGALECILMPRVLPD